MNRPPVDFGDLRRTTPFDPFYGFGRGQPIDRFYIERFLAGARDSIRGRILEVGDDRYASRFGSSVTSVDILDIDPANERATIVDDLSVGAAIPRGAFDCVIVTQVLQLVRDIDRAIHILREALAPGGALLATMPGLSQTVLDTEGEWFWNLTRASARHLFETHFAPSDLDIESFGNVLGATAFLQGLAVEELEPAELEVNDQHYQLLVAIRATRST